MRRHVAPPLPGVPAALGVTVGLNLNGRDEIRARLEGALCRRLLDSQTGPAELPFFNWYELLGEMADNRAFAAGAAN